MNKEQLKQCIVDLAIRSSDLQEEDIAIVLFTLAGAIAMPDYSVGVLADKCLDFSKEQLKIIKKNK
jgi:hypothetical protein